MRPEARNRRLTFAVCGFLLLAVWLVFGQTVHFGFINLDDDLCVTSNPHVKNGFSAAAIRWAFVNHDAGIWNPACWLSHMLDCELFGLRAGGHHLVNVLLHAATAILLFLVLRQMTASLWPSAVAAALFAVHPLRAESVAWVTERRDVLSGLFFVLTLWAYLGYVRAVRNGATGSLATCERASVRAARFAAAGRYLAVMIVFSMGLMVKPMLVTLPCVLLLLDYWPLGRLNEKVSVRDVARLVVEKVPLLAMAAACSAVTVWAEYVSLHKTPGSRWQIENLLVSYVVYLRESFYPAGLAPLAPRQTLGLEPWQVVAAEAVLLTITAGAFLLRRKWPYLIVGWLWFAGMLFPVIGLVPFGTQGTADRFTYLPQIGLCIAAAWGLADLGRSLPRGRWLLAAGCLALLAVLMALAWRQTAIWHDSRTLWTHATRCMPQNYLAYNLLGNALSDLARADESSVDLLELDKAMAEYREAIRLKPRYAEAHFNLGVALDAAGDFRAAEEQYREAVAIEPDYAYALNNLGNVLMLTGRLDEALQRCRRAAEILPTFAQAHYSVGEIWLLRGRPELAVERFRRATTLLPDYLEAQCRYGETLAATGRPADAAAAYRRALDLAQSQHQNALAKELRSRIAQCESAAERLRP
ncbi:MAG: tetratricopeptide repeat protein [Thermoguttaceae bacterium]